MPLRSNSDKTLEKLRKDAARRCEIIANPFLPNPETHSIKIEWDFICARSSDLETPAYALAEVLCEALNMAAGYPKFAVRIFV
jgi:hypothetical protein